MISPLEKFPRSAIQNLELNKSELYKENYIEVLVQSTFLHVQAQMDVRSYFQPHLSNVTVGQLDYLEGHQAIDIANKIFGFNGWSSKIISMKTDYVCIPISNHPFIRFLV